MRIVFVRMRIKSALQFISIVIKEAHHRAQALNTGVWRRHRCRRFFWMRSLRSNLLGKTDFKHGETTGVTGLYKITIEGIAIGQWKVVIK